MATRIYGVLSPPPLKMTEGSSSSRDKPESKLNADRVSRQVSCFAKLNKRIARDEGMKRERERRSGSKKKKKKTIDDQLVDQG